VIANVGGWRTVFVVAAGIAVGLSAVALGVSAVARNAL
jgi:hypothetical protein